MTRGIDLSGRESGSVGLERVVRTGPERDGAGETTALRSHNTWPVLLKGAIRHLVSVSGHEVLVTRAVFFGKWNDSSKMCG